MGLLWAVWLLGGLPLNAQTPSDTLTVEVALAWEGYIRQNLWTEVRVSLKNEGADWQGELVIRDTPNQVTYRRAVELPAHAYKQYRLPLFIKNGTTMLTLSLEDAHGVRWETRLPLRGYGEDSRIVVSADMRGPIVGTNALMIDTSIWLSTLTDLPEIPMAWDAVDVLLLNGMSTADLSAAQQEALLAWVTAGGHLIVGGGPALQQTLANLPEPLRVAVPEEARIFTSLPLQGVTRNTEVMLTLNDVAAVTLQPGAQATPLVKVEDAILAARANVGKGRVDIIGWDLTQPGSDVWLIDLWINDPIPALTALTTEETISSHIPNLSTLLEVPHKALSKIWKMALFFPLYVFLIGPGTLILVRRLKRPVLAWVFIPTWIIGALIVVALGLGSVFSRTFPLVHEMAIITVPDAALPARVVQGTAIYAPRADRLDWNMTGAPRPLRGSYHLNSWYDEGDPFPTEVLYRPGTMNIQAHNPLGILTWGAEGLYDSPAIRSELSLTTQEGLFHITGELWSEANLRDVTLLLGNASYSITLTQTLPPQTTVAITRPATATIASYYGPYVNICGNTNYAYSPYWPSVSPSDFPRVPGACYLTAFIDEVPFPASDIEGFHIQESCLIYTIPCPTQPNGKIEIPLDNINDRIENGWVDSYTGVVYVNAPATTVEYMPPAYLRLTYAEKLTIALLPDPDAGILAPLADITEIAVWNWEEKDWMEYYPSEEIILTGIQAGQAFDPQQGVRLRITPTSNSAKIKMLVTVEGTP